MIHSFIVRESIPLQTEDHIIKLPPRLVFRRQLEQDTGLPFYSECGALVVGNKAFAERAAQGVVPVEHWGDELAARFPFLATNDDDFAVLDAAAGHVDPMAMVAAQNARAEALGARVVADATVGELRLLSTSAGATQRRVVAVPAAAGGEEVDADIAVVCAGAYTLPLLSASGLQCPPPLAAVRVSRRTVLMAEVSEADALGPLANMPTLKYLVQPGTASAPEGHSATEAASVYILPPICYPEYGGRWFVKIGGGPNDFFDGVDDVPSELASFYATGGDAALAGRLEAVLRHAMPGVKFHSMFSKPCVTTCSADGELQLTSLAGGSVIAVTSCQGKAVMSADAIGQEIADLCQAERE